jgi:predicted DNA-binding transcriptional regulator AlpA
MNNCTELHDIALAACLRTRAASRYLGIPESTLTKMRVTGTGPAFVRLTTKSVGYRVSDLDAYLEARVCQSTADRPETMAA